MVLVVVVLVVVWSFGGVEDRRGSDETDALRYKTGSHSRLAIFQLYEVIFPIGN